MVANRCYDSRLIEERSKYIEIIQECLLDRQQLFISEESLYDEFSFNYSSIVKYFSTYKWPIETDSYLSKIYYLKVLGNNQ